MWKFLVLPLLILFILSCGSTADKKELAPVPKSAYGPAVPQDKGYLVEEIRGGLYWVTEGAYLVMFLTTGEGVIVVDAPPSIAEKVLLVVADVTDESIIHMVYSHSHADHIGGAAAYPEGAVIIAQEETKTQLQKAASKNRVFPFGVFVGGHLTRLGTREDVEIQKEYFGDMIANAGTALQSVDFMAVAQEQGFANPWNLFDVYLDAVAEKAAERTLAKWDGRLGGADVWTKDHSFRVLESLRIE